MRIAAKNRLDQNNGGIWTSKESIYLEYDSNTGRLYFPDGTFWKFDCTSAGIPTLMPSASA